MKGDPLEEFHGAKLVLFLGDQIAVIRRDNIPQIVFPNCLDLPGGEREPGETPEDCVRRELREELGLNIAVTDLIWKHFYTAPSRAWFFAARLPETRVQDIRFGDEGQGWWLMPPRDFAADEEAVPHFRGRVLECLAALGL